jgi:hypothetical protein
MKLTFRQTPCEAAPDCLTLFDGQTPVATIVTTNGPNDQERELATLFCAAPELLLRAHDMLCAVVRDNFADVSDLIGDLRLALNLLVTDCDNCRQCIAIAEAVERGGQTLCPDCAEASDSL